MLQRRMKFRGTKEIFDERDEAAEIIDEKDKDVVEKKCFNQREKYTRNQWTTYFL